MHDPHVVRLHYRVDTPDHVDYSRAPRAQFSAGEFDFTLEDTKLTCDPKAHFATIDEARTALAPILRAWEIDADLRLGSVEVRFVYESGDVVDRDPRPGHVLAAGGGRITITGFPATVTVTRKKYPPPPTHFAFSPDVESLWTRYQQHREGREPLLAMAYFCLTVVEGRAGGRKQAAALINVDEVILRTLGMLTSTAGDKESARKAVGQSWRPLTPKQEAWVHATIRLLVRQVGQLDGGQAPTRATLKDLPPLT